MTTITQTNSNISIEAPRIPAVRNGNAISNARGLMTTWFQRSRSRRHLRMLDERLLRDAGIRSEDAVAEMRKPFWVE